MKKARSPDHTKMQRSWVTILVVFVLLGVTTGPAWSQFNADFEGSPTSIPVGGSVVFTDKSVGNITSWGWNFAVGESGVCSPAVAGGAGPHTVQYTQAGTYTVRLMITGGAVAVVYDTEIKQAYITVYEVIDRDWGDAPDPPFNTLSSNMGANHIIVQGFHLGISVDAESNGQQNALANGDDTDGNNDDDGVVFYDIKPMLPSSVQVTASQDGILNAWMDFNRDGDWGDAWADGTEQIFMNWPLNAGVNMLPFPVPSAASEGESFARFRFNSGGDVSYRGESGDGEVEDYMIEILPADTLDFGDAPDSYFTLLPLGAYHYINHNFLLGATVDGEPDGQPDGDAMGDDNAGFIPDDEDGVAIPSPLVIGETADFVVTVVGQGVLRAWFDFDASGSWDDPTTPYIEVGLGPGSHTIPVLIPVTAIAGKTYARFRWSHSGLVTAMGSPREVSYGEVEDYAIILESGDELDFGDNPDSYATTWAANGARHLVSPNIYLGPVVPDSEINGQPSSGADGDDVAGIDDEDGVVVFPPGSPIIPGQTVTFRFSFFGTGFLHAWVDWDANGNFMGNKVITYWNTIGTTTTDLTINVPPTAVLGETYARFRYSTNRALVYWGPGSAGEVEDYVFTITKEDSLDFGDAPDSYKTLLASGGAYHVITDSIRLGLYIDSEIEGQPSGTAVSDDANGSPDDEDGMLPTVPLLIPGTTPALTMWAHNTSGLTGYVNGWIDFNADGDWDDAGEQIYSGVAMPAGLNVHTFSVPDDAVTGITIARLRYSYNPQLPYWGPGGPGEVEDHPLRIVAEFGDAPDDATYHYRTLTGNDGARHTPSTSYFLGALVDPEPDGNPTTMANGDNLANMNDEDGVGMGLLIQGMPAPVHVTATAPNLGYFHGWIDFDGNGDWSGAGEHVFQDHPLTTGNHVLSMNVPGSAVSGWTYARFRFSAEQGVDWFGHGGEGEVEDYRVLIDHRDFDFGDAPDELCDPQYPTLLMHAGAVHFIDPDVYLGQKIDAELDGQPDADALGDDLAADDDEDGVVFDTDLIPGQTADITVTASVAGQLFAWADFDGDDAWTTVGEDIFTFTPLIAGANTLSFPVPDWTTAEKIYLRFRFYQGDDVGHVPGYYGPPYFVGLFPNGEVEDYVVDTGPSGHGAIKWYQPPLKSTKSYYPFSFWGWDEISIYKMPIIADDWFCADPRPVTGVRWWGSYCDWDSVVPPPNAPDRFHIAIWKDKVDTLNVHKGLGFPDNVVWEQTVNRSQISETWVGSDFHHDQKMEPDSCFEYHFSIPPVDWYYQENDSTYYWLTISARYEDEIPEEYLWGWTTRERYFRGDGLRILRPTEPGIDSVYVSGEVVEPGWDMSFILYTTIYGEPFDYGDALDPEYPTEFATNGAHHMLWSNIYMGDGVDAEPDGGSNAEALFDDIDGADDEDGVEFTSEIRAGGFSMVSVNAKTLGILTAWVDFNADGDWDDPGEHVIIDMPLLIGNNNLAFNIPLTAALGVTYARFRFSPVGGITPRGLAIGGEVEDHELTIMAPMAVEEQDILNRMPRKFELMQNYPNPFNPETTIKFGLPHASEVMVTVFDVYGREVRKLLHGEWSTGSHTVVWDGRDRFGEIVATGMYFYRIDARTLTGERKTYMDVKKMIFMK